MTVYLWPYCLGATTRFGGTQGRVRTEFAINGAPAKRTEIAPRIKAEIIGDAPPVVHDDLMIFVDRIAGGTNLAGIWDLDRRRFGWDGKPAFNTTTGAEFWHVAGRTSLYVGNPAADGTTWRSIFAAIASTSTLGATAVFLKNLLPGEIIPKGCLIRIGDYRYVIRQQQVATGGGTATVLTSHPLRAATATDDPVRIPGDFGVFSLLSQDIGPTDVWGVTQFTFQFLEVYAAEVAGGFTYVID